MTSYFSVLTSVSAKSSVVPGHIGCIHVYKINVNPEIHKEKKVHDSGVNRSLTVSNSTAVLMWP